MGIRRKGSETLIQCMYSCRAGTYNLEIAKQLVPPEEGDLLPALCTQHKALHYDTSHHGDGPQHRQDKHSEAKALKRQYRKTHSECQSEMSE